MERGSPLVASFGRRHVRIAELARTPLTLPAAAFAVAHDPARLAGGPRNVLRHQECAASLTRSLLCVAHSLHPDEKTGLRLQRSGSGRRTRYAPDPELVPHGHE